MEETALPRWFMFLVVLAVLAGIGLAVWLFGALAGG
jgi:hypothetical protein